MTERKVYSEEFKREAVRLAQERGNRSGTARELGLSDSVLLRWEKRLSEAGEDAAAFPGQENPRDTEMARLKRENARLEEENTILKKSEYRFQMSICVKSAKSAKSSKVRDISNFPFRERGPRSGSLRVLTDLVHTL